ncbi:hypothetical protein GSI_14371 [Ganoderma sinense ZZ0214-1]|uniref:Uncharacterized protein n=1 Tax=Ganoderma sinense ZZ0214-1 TaxID=1077348 RepID=A0A2G8RNH1_9APHY|nr:hypothetical protein GSI_14371 [Ganoderma sinense ZZ0214-1]
MNTPLYASPISPYDPILRLEPITDRGVPSITDQEKEIRPYKSNGFFARLREKFTKRSGPDCYVAAESGGLGRLRHIPVASVTEEANRTSLLCDSNVPNGASIWPCEPNEPDLEYLQHTGPHPPAMTVATLQPELAHFPMALSTSTAAAAFPSNVRSAPPVFVPSSFDFQLENAQPAPFQCNEYYPSDSAGFYDSSTFAPMGTGRPSPPIGFIPHSSHYCDSLYNPPPPVPSNFTSSAFYIEPHCNEPHCNEPDCVAALERMKRASSANTGSRAYNVQEFLAGPGSWDMLACEERKMALKQEIRRVKRETRAMKERWERERKEEEEREFMAKPKRFSGCDDYDDRAVVAWIQASLRDALVLHRLRVR